MCGEEVGLFSDSKQKEEEKRKNNVYMSRSYFYMRATGPYLKSVFEENLYTLLVLIVFDMMRTLVVEKKISRDQSTRYNFHDRSGRLLFGFILSRGVSIL